MPSGVLSDRDRGDLADAVRLITERGYHRGRDLTSLLTEYLATC